MGAGRVLGGRARAGVSLGLVLLVAAGVLLAGETLAAHGGPGPSPGRAGGIPAAGPAPSAGPYYAYGNATIVLPAWNSLSAYAWNCNTNVSVSVGSNCFGSPRLGFAGSQVPLVSWTASGAYYVNASFDLVFYSFLTRTVTVIAPWLPLYDDTMYYTGTTNTEYITADGSYVYEFGCLVPTCRTGAGTTVTSYAVNVTTGRTFEHTWSTLILAGASSVHYTTYWNAQTNMVGVDGNDSILTLTVTWGPLGSAARNGTVWAYNLWTGVEWELGELPVFEANNLYWLPQFSQFFDVSAEDSGHDEVYQALLAGSPAQPALAVVGPYVYSTGGFAIGGVDGLWVDLETREVAFQADWQGNGKVLDVVAQLGSDGTIAGFPTVLGPFVPGDDPSPLAGEHRPSLVTTPTAFAPPQLGDPEAWLSDPLSASTATLPTNVTQNITAWNVDGSLFYNTSYSVLTGSDQCERVSTDGTDCALLGENAGTAPGTVWWTWRLGLTEFPFPAGAPVAEPLAPPPIPVEARQTPGGFELNWTVPASELDPMLNYSVSWGTVAGAPSHWASLPGDATDYTGSGAGSNRTVFYTVEAWNLHGPSTTAGNLSLTPIAVPSAPSLAVSFADDPGLANAANVTVVMTEGAPGAGPIRNDTLSWGTAPGVWTHNLSGTALGLAVGSGQVTWKIDDVPVNATYYFEGGSWNAYGEGPESNVVSITIPAETHSPAPSGGSSNGIVPILEVAGGVVAVVVVGAALVILLARRRRRGRPPA
jgi:hypothetical protein